MKQMPTLVAHRGQAAKWPENTLPALAAAVAAGARWVEVDVQLCADGIPVLLHDADLARAAGRATSVFELTAAELAEISIGYPARFGARFGTEFPAAHVPTLAEFADWLALQPGVDAFVELKEESLQRFGRAAVLNACVSAMTPAQGRWAPISFDREVLALAGAAGLPELGWVLHGFDDSVAAQARELPARWLFCNHQRLPPGPLPPGPWDWVLYEVADAVLARALVARGAQWLETMDIEALRQALLQDAAQTG
jgi:glycerophosphoryl diester phosphodiesterase